MRSAKGEHRCYICHVFVLYWNRPSWVTKTQTSDREENPGALMHGYRRPTFRAVLERIGESGVRKITMGATGVWRARPEEVLAALTGRPLPSWLDNRTDKRERRGTLVHFEEMTRLWARGSRPS